MKMNDQTSCAQQVFTFASGLQGEGLVWAAPAGMLCQP